ncbi:hypothetical protein QE152_g38249 [Popillia japonica]|uniref:Uncharacterized protein n=1 Tax=Popillia japonica TaxID=7064 RepID=A0AAW1I7S3_POPJA
MNLMTVTGNHLVMQITPISSEIDATNSDDENNFINNNSNFTTIDETIEQVVHSVPTTSAIPTTSKSKKPDILWKRSNLILNNEQMRFSGNENLSSEIMNLDTPFSFFTDELVMNIVKVTYTLYREILLSP